MSKTKEQQVLDLLMAGWVSPLDSWRICGASRFSAIIYSLKKKGYRFEERPSTSPSRIEGKADRYKEFRIARDVKEPAPPESHSTKKPVQAEQGVMFGTERNAQ